MAPSAHSSLNTTTTVAAGEAGTTFNSATGGESERDIWSSILQQVQKQATNKLPSNKSILVLGDNDSGKTSLIAKMQGTDTTCKGSGLEYHYLMVRDEYRDEQTQCGVWILDGNYQWKTNLLKFALNADNFADTTILLVCSMTKPWDIINSLHHWVDVLEAHIKSLNLDPKVLKSFREQNRRRFQDYISPGDEIEGLTSSLHRSRTLSSATADGITPTEPERDPLPDNVLCNNLGLDLVVAVTKTDFMSTLEKEYDYKEEHFDFIQQAIRKFCLNYGAALMYVSAKINKNCDLLYKYLIHRVYGLQFKTPALVVEKDALFIPSGWDNEKKIAILYENIQSFSPDDNYNDIISVPLNAQLATKEQEIVAEDDQIFLIKLRTQLNSQQTPNTPSSGTVGTTPIRSTNATPTVPSGGTSSATGKTDRRSTSSIGGSTPESAKGGGPGGEGVLQTFFNSLLNRKSVSGTSVGGASSPATTPRTSGSVSGSGSGGTPSSAAAAAASADALRARDVHAELDRIIEGNKWPSNKSSSDAGEN